MKWGSLLLHLSLPLPRPLLALMDVVLHMSSPGGAVCVREEGPFACTYLGSSGTSRCPKKFAEQAKKWCFQVWAENTGDGSSDHEAMGSLLKALPQALRDVLGVTF